MTRFLAALCTVLLGLAPMHAVHAQPADPAAIEAFFDDTIGALMDGTGIPGVTLSVVQNGEVVVLKGYGVSDIKTGEPMDPEKTAVRIGSITKPLTAIAALQQVDAGTLDLSADINEYLSPYQVPDTYPEPVTAHHILTHQSGFDADISYMQGPRFELEAISAEEIGRRLVRVRRPGEIAAYDNLGFGILGLVIESASGRHYEEVVEKDIFQPLGMNDSYIGLPPSRTINLAGCHWWASPEKIFSCEHDRFSDLSQSAGAAASTASDMAKLMLWFLDENKNEGGPILSTKSFADLINFDNYRPHPLSPGIGRSLPEMILSDRRAFGHGGGLSGFITDMAIYPDANMGFFIGLAGSPGHLADIRLSMMFEQILRSPNPDTISLFQDKFGGLKKAFAEKFVPPSQDWPPELSIEAQAQLEKLDSVEKLQGIYRGVRNTSETLLVKLFSGAQATTITAQSTETLLSSASGVFQRTAPLIYENKENGQGLAVRVTESNSYLLPSTMPLGGAQQHPSYSSPFLTLLPVPIALLFLFSSIVYLFPRFAGTRRQAALLSLLGAAVFLGTVYVELEYATWFIYVEGSVLIPSLWRLVILFGLGVLLLAVTRVVKTWRDQGYGTGWRGVVQKGHGALIAASCLTIVSLSAYWAVV